MDELIGKVQMELEKEREGSVDSSAADKRVVQLRAETRELASEVNNLIRLLAELRSMEIVLARSWTYCLYFIVYSLFLFIMLYDFYFVW
jgi:hypothetical protein